MATTASRGQGTSTSMVVGNVKKVHTTYPNGSEMIEEYDAKTDRIRERKIRDKNALGQWLDWEWEIGEPVRRFNPNKDLLAPSSRNPIFLRKDTKGSFSWRVRNLPYSRDVYSVTVDDQDQKIVIRTSNKKYYKRIKVQELTDVDIALEEDKLSWDYGNNTLIISYEKPEAVLQAEKRAKEQRRNVPNHNRTMGMGGGSANANANGANAASDCKQQ